MFTCEQVSVPLLGYLDGLALRDFEEVYRLAAGRIPRVRRG